MEWLRRPWSMAEKTVNLKKKCKFKIINKMSKSLFEKTIINSIVFNNTNIPAYLTGVYSKIVDIMIPQILQELPEKLKKKYFVYGGRANLAYNPLSHPLTSDWDIIVKDQKDDILVPFVMDMGKQLQRLVESEYSNINSPIIIKTINNNYDPRLHTGRYIISLVDPYSPYEKMYDCMDIAGCHEVDTISNYCDIQIFKNCKSIDNIMYAGNQFIVSETNKVVSGVRKSQLKTDKKSLLELINIIKNAEDNWAENLDEVSITDSITLGEYIHALKALEDASNLYTSSYIKFQRTTQRQTK